MESYVNLAMHSAGLKTRMVRRAAISLRGAMFETCIHPVKANLFILGGGPQAVNLSYAQAVCARCSKLQNRFERNLLGGRTVSAAINVLLLHDVVFNPISYL